MFPNPANYYLPTPFQFETEFTELDYGSLAETLNEITYSLTHCGTDPVATDDLSQECDDWINTLTPEQKISLVRWLAERLDYLAHGTTNATA
jgi:hypothetical protein